VTRAVDAVKPDVRDAVRALRRRPGFTATAVAILGLGIGGSAALFSVADRALLRPLPYREAEHLVTVWDTRPADARDHEHPSPGNYLDWSARIAGFESLAAWQDGSGVSTLRSGDVPLVVETVKVTPSFFRVLGAEAERGRTFDDRRERGSVFDATDRFSGGDRVLVMSHGLWSSRFGRDPGVVGRTIMLDGVPWRVLGVMPPGFAMPRRTTQLFLPWDMKASFASVALGPPRDLRFLNVVARLRPGVSRARAQAELEALSAVLADQHPQANAG
jgi:hypothetical protein